jgi:hypothetical protein
MKPEKRTIMNRQRLLLWALICFFVILALSINSSAQEQEKKKGKATSAKRRSDAVIEATFKLLEAKYVFEKVVKGAPYSATAITETIQTLSDGNQIIQKSEIAIYRDSEGRTRREQTLAVVNRWSAEGDAPRVIFINDPVAGIQYTLDPRTQTARRTAASQSELLAMEQYFMELDAAVREIEVTEGVFSEPEGFFSELDSAVAKTGKGTRKKKRRSRGSIEKQMIEGVEAEGTRNTSTIPAGQIGNKLPIEIVDERWYSPELQTVVMTRHYDPRSGETIYRLTNIDRREPDRSLFEVPAGYTLKDVLTTKTK